MSIGDQMDRHKKSTSFQKKKMSTPELKIVLHVKMGEHSKHRKALHVKRRVTVIDNQ
jgi:hypothetical protein